MGYNFPNTPTTGQVFYAPGGPAYVWNGTAWQGTGSGVYGTAEARNRIVNGAMQISQELGVGASATTNGGYAGDQWALAFVTSGAPSSGILTDTDGLNLLRLLAGATADTSIAATDQLTVRQPIEGIRITDFQFGTANAKPLVLRFSARTNFGAFTMSVAIRSGDGSRSFIKNVGLTATLQDFVIPIPACTDGTWAAGNVVGMWLNFTGMCGSTNIGAAENTWLTTSSIAAPGIGNLMSVANQALYIRNVSLYLDPNATGKAPPWQTPDEAQELEACKRYYNRVGANIRFYSAYAGHYQTNSVYYPTMRAVPTLSYVAGSRANTGTLVGYPAIDSLRFEMSGAAAGPDTYALGETIILFARM